jgi:hypothetical protein
MTYGLKVEILTAISKSQNADLEFCLTNLGNTPDAVKVACKYIASVMYSGMGCGILVQEEMCRTSRMAVWVSGGVAGHRLAAERDFGGGSAPQG